jgi:hypothetical protein
MRTWAASRASLTLEDVCEDGCVVCEDGCVVCEDGCVVCEDGDVVCQDACVVYEGACVVCEGVREDDPHAASANVRPTTESAANRRRAVTAPRSPRWRGLTDIATDSSAHAARRDFRQDQSV